MKEQKNYNLIGYGLLLLGGSGGSLYYAWQIFQTGKRNNLQALQTCSDEAQGLGQETLGYYGQCVELLQSSTSGVWIFILLGVVLEIIGSVMSVIGLFGNRFHHL